MRPNEIAPVLSVDTGLLPDSVSHHDRPLRIGWTGIYSPDSSEPVPYPSQAKVVFRVLKEVTSVPSGMKSPVPDRNPTSITIYTVNLELGSSYWSPSLYNSLNHVP